MKILFINNSMHLKNKNALYNYGFEIIETYDTNLGNFDLNNFDVVYSPCRPIDVSKYPNTKFLFGPHFSVFPVKYYMDTIIGKNSMYVQPSEWVRDLWKNNILCKENRIEALPFGVDTNKFNENKPISERRDVFIYFKRRKHQELNFMVSFLQKNGFNPKIFDYVSGYNEHEYIDYLHNSKFAIWITASESQGFALLEALSCNVPLLVWNVTSLNQEEGSNYIDIPASTIPYWDNRCGEYFTNLNELDDKYNTFINNLEKYKPREYILENLSFEKCSKKFIDIVNKI